MTMEPRPAEALRLRDATSEQMFIELSHRIGPEHAASGAAVVVLEARPEINRLLNMIHGPKDLICAMLLQAAVDRGDPGLLLGMLLEMLQLAGKAKQVGKGVEIPLPRTPPPGPSQS